MTVSLWLKSENIKNYTISLWCVWIFCKEHKSSENAEREGTSWTFTELWSLLPQSLSREWGICVIYVSIQQVTNQHLKSSIHLGQWKYSCNRCEYIATELSTLKNHMNTRHLRQCFVAISVSFKPEKKSFYGFLLNPIEASGFVYKSQCLLFILPSSLIIPVCVLCNIYDLSGKNKNLIK